MIVRFIFHFIFFGILFYLIWLFFPEAFTTLASWAGKVYVFFKNLFLGISEKVTPATKPPASTPEPKTLLLFFNYFVEKYF